MQRKKLVIVGGVAGGASCAARARRISEDWDITVFERGPYVSFANCGLPYYVGRVIEEEEHLLLATPALFKHRFNIDVRTRHEVLAVDTQAREVEIRSLKSGKTSREGYDVLVLSPGAAPVKPRLPGMALPGIFTVRNIPDTQAIMKWLTGRPCEKAVVVGGGFIGLEMCENLMKRGLSVTVVEMQAHVLPVLDPEMAAPLHGRLEDEGVELRLGRAVTGFAQGGDSGLVVSLDSGENLPADLVVMSVGVRPEVELAKAAGIALGETGGILVDKQMRTSAPDVYAVGDAVEVECFVTGAKRLIPLAGPANRQGRLAADVIMGLGSPPPEFQGVLGTAVCGVFGLTAASTGETEKSLKALAAKGREISYEKVYVHPLNHSGYYPGAENIALKLIYEKPSGRILGAQAVGGEGTEKRIDVIATAMRFGGTAYDLEQAELCYAPQYGSAKDAVNIAGMVAVNALTGFMPMVHWENLDGDGVLLDVRTKPEVVEEPVPGALHMDINELRRRMDELPKDKAIHIFCYLGQRGHVAARLLQAHGYKAYNVAGGYLTWVALQGGKE
jgi:NADPH-dependent 2,4-dienoyl-CoA reductase/sulfur reductase-like enzyme/rhodanese-related sulfurtransferase